MVQPVPPPKQKHTTITAYIHKPEGTGLGRNLEYGHGSKASLWMADSSETQGG